MPKNLNLKPLRGAAVPPTGRFDVAPQEILKPAKRSRPANGEFDEDAPGEPRAGFKIPKNLAEAADLAYRTKLERYALQKQVKSLRAEQTALEEHLINNLPKSQAEGITGKSAKAQIKRQEKPRVEDWEKFYAYVAKTKSFDLLQRRSNDKAIVDRWAAKKQIPGVGKFQAVSVSLTKA